MTFTAKRNKDIVKRLQYELEGLEETRKTIGSYNIEADLMIRRLHEIITPRLKSEDKN